MERGDVCFRVKLDADADLEVRLKPIVAHYLPGSPTSALVYIYLGIFQWQALSSSLSKSVRGFRIHDPRYAEKNYCGPTTNPYTHHGDLNGKRQGLAGPACGDNLEISVGSNAGHGEDL
ncbi:hypothetical protein BKA70DRAFT_1433208 [Coprinopsis sp. MPI-PUGE-AT-0042]|nr:hypothetical protein BKA70DRAFT_1433208 [Coprinopsis sp. MPI-PUGE-AT-0042]